MIARTVRNWKARPAGGRITISGKDENGIDIKVVGVDDIYGPTASTAETIAYDRDGKKWVLA